MIIEVDREKSIKWFDYSQSVTQIDSTLVSVSNKHIVWE